MKQLSFFLFVATGLILCATLHAQQYHDAAAFGLKGNVKECKVVYAIDGSNAEDPHGFCSLSFSQDGKLEAIEKRSHPDCERRISDIVRSNGLLMGFKSEYESSYGFIYDYDFRFHYNGNELIGFHTRYSFGQKVAHGPGIKGYNVYSFLGSGKDSFKQESFDFKRVSFSDRFEAMIEEGFEQGGNFIPKLKSVAEEIWDIYYDRDYSQTKYIIKTRDSHGNYTILANEDGASIKRIITYWDDEPATAKTTQATEKPSADPAPKPAITEKTQGLRPATPKELSILDLITRPFGVLSQNSRKLSRKQLLYDLSDYGWIDNDQDNLKINLRARDGYDMVILGKVPDWAYSDFVYDYDDHYYDTEKTALTSFGYSFEFDKGKDANKFIHQLVDLLKAEGINMTEVKKYHAFKGRFKNSEIYLSNSVNRNHVSLFINYQVLGTWIQ